MITEKGPVIVITGECPSGPAIHAARVRHRTLPVVCGEGTTTREAVEDLVRKLIRESSSVVGWKLQRFTLGSHTRPTEEAKKSRLKLNSVRNSRVNRCSDPFVD